MINRNEHIKGLTWFLFKTMRRIVDDMVKRLIPNEKLKCKQRTLVKKKSADSALHRIIHHIEKSYKENDYALNVFIDIEDVFKHETLIQF